MKLLIIFLFSITCTATCLKDVKHTISHSMLRSKKHKLKTKPFNTGYVYKYLKNVFVGTSHFQGIFLNSQKDLLIATGADVVSQRTDLFIYQKDEKKWSLTKYMNTYQHPFWHIGSLGGTDEFLAVPYESLQLDRTKKAEIRFLDIRDKDNIHFIDYKLMNRAHSAAATDMIQMQDGRLLLVVLDHKDFKFYISKTELIEEGFRLISIVPKGSITFENGEVIKSKGQSVQILEQCDGKIYIVEFDENGNNLSYYFLKKSYLYLYDINLNKNDKLQTRQSLKMDYNQRINFMCDFYCNFDAGSNLMVFKDQLEVQSLYHYTSLFGRKIKFKTFMFKERKRKSLFKNKKP